MSQWGARLSPGVPAAFRPRRFPRCPRASRSPGHRRRADPPARSSTGSDLGTPPIFVSGFDRPNIHYSVVPKNNARAQFRRFLNRHHKGDAGIVYCLSRKKVDGTAEWLRSEGVNALPVPRRSGGGRAPRQPGPVSSARKASSWWPPSPSAWASTKPNVRFVAHLDLPKSIEAYYQETGRAGPGTGLPRQRVDGVRAAGKS